MPIPWDDEVTASIDGQNGRDIVAHGPLRVVLPGLALHEPAARARMVLAFHDRYAPPFRYDGTQIDALAAALERNRPGRSTR